MSSEILKKIRWQYLVAAFLVLFGIVTLKEGGAVLFFDSAAREAAGNYVPFVLWFNFLAGFVYIAAGVAIALQSYWALRLSFTIASLSLLVLVALGVHIFGGGLYEKRTLIAMTLRTAIWMLAFYYVFRNKQIFIKANK